MTHIQHPSRQARPVRRGHHHRASTHRNLHHRPTVLAVALQGIVASSLALGPCALPRDAHAQAPAAAGALPKGDAVTNFDVPAGPLDAALDSFARAAGVNLSYDEALIAGLTTRGLRGSYGASAGLLKLLDGSGIEALAQPGGGYSLRRATAAGADSSAKAGALPPVTVRAAAIQETATGQVSGYVARRAATALKTDTPLAETPQSVTVVTRDQMDDLGATTIQQALTYAAGVRGDPYGLDSRADWGLVRGSEPTVYRDGVWSFGGYGNTTRTDPYTLERMEILRGPSGMLFGAGTAGGVINLISKRPLQETRREVGIQLGNYHRRQIQADLTGPLTEDGAWSYRLIAVYRDADTQTDFVPDNRALLAPSLSWRPNASTSLILQGQWQRDETGMTNLGLPWSGSILPNPNGRLPSSRYLGEPQDGFDTRGRRFGWLFEHRFNDDWRFRQATRIERNTSDARFHSIDYWTILGGWGEDPVNQRIIGRYNFRGITRTALTATDNHLEGSIVTGSLRHRLLVGVDHMRHRTDLRSGVTPSTLDAYAPVHGADYAPITDFTEAPRAHQRNVGVYIQDQIRLGNWIVVAGLRHDRATSKTQDESPATTRASTKRLGVMYGLPAGWSPYLSYTESFTPQAGRTEEGALYKPLRGEQVEAGIKYTPSGVPLSAAASIYRLKEKNRTVADPDSPFFGTQVDASENKGIELELKATMGKAFDLTAYYQYTVVDQKLALGVPRNQAAFWGKYRFALASLSGFEVGAGLRYLSAFKDRIETGETGPRVPSVTLIDLLLAYESKHWRYALNINNLTGREYFSTCLARGDCWWGPRRSIIATVSYRF
ncbi:MAG: TonB-dependent siderophore receptor [Burkholderiaceae bacterium]